MKKIAMTVAGFVAVALGTAGVFLPVLPTTPFLLLAAWLFMKGNPRWRVWLVNHKYFGRYISNYIEYHAIPRKTKIISIVVLWTTIIISGIFVDLLWVRLLLLCVAVGVTVHLLLLKTLD